jgi:hypothetical protein
MSHSEKHDGKLQALETNCDKCILKKMAICPYLQEIEECHLFNDLQSQKMFDGFKEEKRRFPRMTTSVPAFISKGGSGEAKLHIGSLMDISLGGLRISIPRAMKHKVLTIPQTNEFEIMIALPDENEPIHLKCKSRRVTYSKDNIDVGAFIIDTDFRSYKALVHYCM